MLKKGGGLINEGLNLNVFIFKVKTVRLKTDSKT